MILRSPVAACVLALAGPVAHVKAETAAPAGTPLTLEVQALHGTYLARERIGSVLLNQDKGQLSGGALALAANWTPMTLRLAGRHLQGDMAYQGYTQFGLPLRTHTALRWQQWQVSAAPTGRLPTLVGDLGVAVGFGQLALTRGIAATARSLAVTETLRLGVLSASGDWQLALPGGGQLRWQLQWNHALERRLAIDSGGVLDRYQLVPRHGHWVSLDAGLQWPLAHGWQVVTTLQHDALRVANAPARQVFRQGQLAGISSYPGSHQRRQTLGLGLQLAL